MRVLGLDISYTRTGIVLLESRINSMGMLEGIDILHSSTLKFPPSERRLLKAYVEIAAKITDLIHRQIDFVVIEDLAYSAPSMVVTCKLGELGAVFKLALEVYSIPYLTVSPTLVRKFLCGRGDANKEQVATTLGFQYKITFEKDAGHDLSDAAALAVWGLKK